MPSDDFNLIDTTFLKIAEKGERQGLGSLTEPEKIIDLIWRASGLIGNGGLQYFYEQEFDAKAVALAYERTGCDKCAEIIRLSLSLFPNSLPQEDWDARIQYIESHTELFDSLSTLFWKADAGTEKRLAEFVRANADKICQPNP